MPFTNGTISATSRPEGRDARGCAPRLRRGGGSAERRSVRALPAQCAGRTALRAVASGTRGTLLREASAPLTFRDARLSALHRGIFPFVRASLASEEKTSATAGWAAEVRAPRDLTCLA